MSKNSNLINDMGQKARAAQFGLRDVDADANALALKSIAVSIRESKAEILAANALDMAAGQKNNLAASMIDRLFLDVERVKAIAAAVETVAALESPVGQIIDERTQSNGLNMRRVRVPIGVIGIIYESRPNVTVDAAVLCLRSGNAAILRGGSEAVNSNKALHAAMVQGIKLAGLPEDAVQLLPSQDRALVGEMLAASGQIDLIIPRGGKSLVARVQADARVPVLAHLDGICHSYVDKAADSEKAKAIIVNAKMRRTGICGAMETLLIDQDYPAPAALIRAMIEAGCEVRGDDAIMELDERTVSAEADDWGKEYLAPVVAAAMVSGVDGALAHIAEHGSDHTDVIITEDSSTAEYFLGRVDSAIAMWNASSQFADGGEFGLGAEIGIATGRLHARGPVALEGLTTYKWVVRGTGQIRP